MSIKIGDIDVSYIKVGSDDCQLFLGDVKVYPKPSYKLIAQYSDNSEYKVECDGSSALTSTEVSSHTTSITAMTSAVINGCDMSTFKVGDEAFSGATSLSSVTLNEGITEIGVRAFTYTSNLRSITFPSTLTKLDGVNFRYSGIRSISGIPSGVTYLGSGTFADMFSLSAATIPSSVTGSSTNLFLRDSGLTEVHFESRTVPALGADAFKNCTALIKIYIPDCDCYDSYAAQSQFSGLTDLIYGEDNTKCKPVPVPKTWTVSQQNWNTSTDTSGNIYYIQKSASSSSELTTYQLGISGISEITFSVSAANGSGIRFSSSKDDYATGQSTKNNETCTITGLTPTESYIVKCQLLRRDGTYITGTNAQADITWS